MTWLRSTMLRVEGRLDEELQIAHNIQVSMLPKKAPEIEGLMIAARSIPAREVGGDFYDFIEMCGNGTGNRLGIVIGDVSGKAVSGALVMAASRSIFRILAEVHPSIEEVMRIGNQHLNRDIKKGMFVALLYAVVDPQHKTLTFSNAGQRSRWRTTRRPPVGSSKPRSRRGFQPRWATCSPSSRVS